MSCCNASGVATKIKIMSAVYNSIVISYFVSLVLLFHAEKEQVVFWQSKAKELLFEFFSRKTQLTDGSPAAV